MIQESHIETPVDHTGQPRGFFKRHRSQRGTLYVSGGKRGLARWMGRWYRYWLEQGVRRCKQETVIIGRKSELSEAEAREKLLAFIQSQEVLYYYDTGGAGDVRDQHLRDTVKVGTASELRVCADLLLRRFEVYRSVSHTASCDLIILRSGASFRVEVKTAHYAFQHKVTYARPRIGYFDLLAIVHPTGAIEYQVADAETQQKFVGFCTHFEKVPRIYEFLETTGTKPRRRKQELLPSDAETAKV